MRLLPVDERLSLRGNTFQDAIEEDKRNGYIPFYVSYCMFFVSMFPMLYYFDVTSCCFQLCATLGTTGACAFDNLQELGPICKCF